MIEEIWTEKYRPKKLDDITGQSHIIPRLREFVNNKSLPHCLFAGPAGCGKTTAALCIANEFFGKGLRGNFLELNASDERGIETVRVKVKDFARTMPMEGLFKIVYLDEADSLTRDAQHALRRTMENYAHICRFILACNYSGKIIPPLQSRTAVFRFLPLDNNDMEKTLISITKTERMKVDKGAYNAILQASAGDMRKAINILQTASGSKKIDEKTIFDVTSRSDPFAVRKMLEIALDGKFREARKTLHDLLYERGIPAEDIIKEIHNQVLEIQIDENKRISLIEKIGEYEFRLTEGSNPQIQLEALLAQISSK